MWTLVRDLDAFLQSTGGAANATLGSNGAACGPRQSIPAMIDGGRVLFYSRIDRRHRLRRSGQEETYGLVICEQKGSPGVFLFTCEEDWAPIFDSWHTTIKEAKKQAAFQWDGIEATWEEPPDTVDPHGPKGK